MMWSGSFRLALIGAILLCGQISLPRVGWCATQEEIDATIARARVALKRMWEASGPSGQRTLTAVALLKAGEPHGGPIEKAEIASIRTKIHDGAYRAVGHEAIYIAGVEAMLIGEIPDEAVRDELMAPVAKFLLETQRENGSWDYTAGGAENRGTNGDTSVTQYACLGLWSAQRAGIEIDRSVWERVVNWHVQTAGADGLVSYTPAKPTSPPPSPQMAVNSLSSIHIAILQINPAAVPKLLDGSVPVVRPAVPTDQKKFGVLEAVPLDRVPKKRPVDTNVAVSQSAGPACNKIYRALVPTMKVRRVDSTHLYYYLYSLERLAALADRKDFEGYDWYADNAEMLVRTQRPDGVWGGGLLGESVDASFALMFLVRATAKLLDRDTPIITKRIGGGLLAGGRGLPDNLSAAPKSVKKSSPLGDLLSSLEKANADILEETQDELVEKVQLGDRKELIGNTELILKLVGHPTPAVRQTAVWALGRTNNLSLARHLVKALDDKDPTVRVEAHNALCWMTRNPTAFDLLADPLADVPEDAPAEARAAAQSAWHRDAFLAWGKWYLDRRPFADRGDEFETWLRMRLRELK